MIWIEIIADKLIPDERLCEVFEELLNIPPEEIQIVLDCGDFPDANTMTMVCQKSIFQSGFAMMLSLYLFGDAGKNTPEVDQFVASFSNSTNCKCLLPTEDENPDQMMLYDGSRKEIVYIDGNIFERDGIYVLSK